RVFWSLRCTARGWGQGSGSCSSSLSERTMKEPAVRRLRGAEALAVEFPPGFAPTVSSSRGSQRVPMFLPTPDRHANAEPAIAGRVASTLLALARAGSLFPHHGPLAIITASAPRAGRRLARAG